MMMSKMKRNTDRLYTNALMASWMKAGYKETGIL